MFDYLLIYYYAVAGLCFINFLTTHAHTSDSMTSRDSYDIMGRYNLNGCETGQERFFFDI